MPDPAVTEEPLQFGAGGRLFGIMTTPGSPPESNLPMFVLFNAGLLHRVGPYRLHVRLARRLAAIGFSSLRVDLAGKGDSPGRLGVSILESVDADFVEIAALLDSRAPSLTMVLGGLCSGADNAIRLASADPRVVGMLLLDPICAPDEGFRARELYTKFTTPARYASWLKRRIRRLRAPRARAENAEEVFDPLTLREQPTDAQLRAAFEAVISRDGRVFSAFTRYSTRYYNSAGQLGRVLGLDGYERFCTERYWPQAEHTYRVEAHRLMLIDEVESWAACYRQAGVRPSGADGAQAR